jgi:hypothetical protein|tara:strand:- start:1090 stop:1284 length:195 start_codon:yes stop_codon:yes gene_type:complete
MSPLKVTLIILLGLASLSCSSGDSKMGYWIDDKPLRGTIRANKENVHPYRQCVDEETFKNINCK